MPEVAVDGTSHDAESSQLPQSTSPVVGSLMQLGCACGSVAVGASVATLRAPSPP
jgi:hypothetical protein